MIGRIHTMPPSILYDRGAVVNMRIGRYWKQGTSQFGRVVRKSSPFTRNWICDWTGHDVMEEEWRVFEQFVDTIDGPTGLFYLHDPYTERPRGIATGIGRSIDDAIYFTDGAGFTDGSPLIAPGKHIGFIDQEAEAGSDTIVVNGMVPSRDDCLIHGDRFSIAHGPNDIWTLYKALTSAHSDADGKAVITIYPRLRYPVMANGEDEVNFYRPAGVFMLVTDPEMAIRPPVNMAPRFRAVENPSVLYELDRLEGGST